jgi:hypothetical protein
MRDEAAITYDVTSSIIASSNGDYSESVPLVRPSSRRNTLLEFHSVDNKRLFPPGEDRSSLNLFEKGLGINRSPHEISLARNVNTSIGNRSPAYLCGTVYLCFF